MSIDSVEIQRLKNENELLHALHVLHGEQECTILEVFTPRLENAEILDNFFKAIHLNHE